MKKIKRTIEIVDNVPVGLWLASFDILHGFDDETGREWIDDIEAHKPVKVTSKNYLDLNAQVVNMTLETNTDSPYDDTHDFRPRLFKTKQEALDHIEYTVKRWKNPQPWESFVKY